MCNMKENNHTTYAPKKTEFSTDLTCMKKIELFVKSAGMIVHMLSPQIHGAPKLFVGPRLCVAVVK